MGADVAKIVVFIFVIISSFVLRLISWMIS